MASNKELTEQALELDPEAKVDGLNNKELSALVADLKNPPAADSDEAPEPVAKAKPDFYMAPRKSITSKKGILSGDSADEVKAEYLHGGEEALEAFIKSGHILRG